MAVLKTFLKNRTYDYVVLDREREAMERVNGLGGAAPLLLGVCRECLAMVSSFVGPDTLARAL